MKFNKWTLGLAAVGVVSLTSAARADESKLSQVQTALSDTTISGYVDVSAQFNPNGGGSYNGVTGPNYNFGNKANGINLNVVDIAIDKPLDESPWAAGYHVEFWVGPDGTTLGVGNDIRSAYIALRTPVGNGIDWKLGVWDTIIGYEGTTSGNNPNYSRSFGYNLEPTTHTGLLASYKIIDEITVQAGVANTSYAGGGAYSAAYNNAMYLPTVLGLVTLTAPESFGWAQGATLSGGIVNTSGSVPQSTTGVGGVTGDGNGATSYYAGFTLPTPVKALKFGGSFDYLNARDIGANTWVVAGYGTYQFNDKLSLNLRAENQQGGGNSTAGVQLSGGAYGPDFANGGPNQQAQEVTATLQYALWANVLTRLEVRWDHVSHGEGYINNTASYATPTPQANAFLLALQAIYTF